ncbi:phosphate ABC transporter substrate-binding protein PstS [Schumannella sp. 10F1B-5-1]|uniref:phosphate ABC transporter substrate-binding protein PstS n=1 Tax=Schumannella sp. 10F1B-5-1 TaxID=2590780 RepID=UPI0011308229|nr:phosphate ABC transporter substrate-binding protein PstS [Schumannella sp. 10F1B-5-1]TPW73638.1 phosphate ABC transporter substrate-binding protein PstS [Schumannella sp. 10F1B-5-1]
MIRTTGRRLIAAAITTTALAALAVVGAGPASPASAASYVAISGSGSTWSQNALDQWRRNVATNYGMQVNYSGTGSSAGRTDFINGTVDYAVSEIPFQSTPDVPGAQPENPEAGSFAYMPIVAGGTSFMYNLKIGGKRVTNLRLSGDVITKIFTNQITNWNDAAIQADNPGLAMPNKAITPVVRSDGSGSTAQFTLWMSKMYPSIWSAYSGRSGLTSQYPVKGSMKAQNGSLGVAGYVSQGYGEGAITYVEYSYAMKSGFPVAKVLNASGYYVEPTAASVAVALMQARINGDLTQNLDGVYANTDKRNYPLSSYSYMIVPTKVRGIFTEAKGNTLGTFASYMLCEGQQQASALGYSPLPMNLVKAGFAQIARIPGASSANVDVNKCNNPTFKPGQSESDNVLAQTAPQPAACDQKGPNQCTTGTAGAKTDTAVSGSGSGGSASGGSSSGSGGGSSTGATTGDAGGTTGDPVYDENGQLVSSTTAGGAVSKPFDLPDSGFGPGQFAMVAALLLLVGAIVLPPLLSRRMRASDRRPDS